MTRIWNNPDDFAGQMLEGFVAANRRYVNPVRGGVVRAAGSPHGQVAVVIGGGAGHYPAFCGLVGPGLAHGAAMGNLFASPSTQQIHSVAKAAEAGGGVLFSYGNYAGDVLNFDAAQNRLRAEGIACETVTVTDDIASSPPAEKHKRRGVAGDLTVFRAVAAAAESGYALDEVARIGRLANERTRSFGVAFSGCTLPGASEALFTVPEGRMAIGLGIHGEPGIDEVSVPTADELGELLVSRLLEELPDGVDTPHGARVVPVLNGLGSLKYEEMFVIYRRIAGLLRDAGVEVVDPHVGEFCTSFDMAGVSLTFYWLNDELERLWEHPVDSPAYRRGSVVQMATTVVAEEVEADEFPLPESDEASRAVASVVTEVLRAVVEVIDSNVEHLGRLDAVAGDGDHGIGMQRGARAASDAAMAALAVGAGAASTLRLAGDAWADRGGGTSGALWGVMLRAVSERLGDIGAPSGSRVVAGVAAAASEVMAHGKAAVGDKTLVDALVPFARELEVCTNRGDNLSDAWNAAAGEAAMAAEQTAKLEPRMGRARTHGVHSVGTPDPGAVSLALVAQAIGDVLLTVSHIESEEVMA